MKRNIRKLSGISKDNYQYALEHNRRPFVFSMTFKDGATWQMQGNVKPERCERLAEILQELTELHGEK